MKMGKATLQISADAFKKINQLGLLVGGNVLSISSGFNGIGIEVQNVINTPKLDNE